MIILISIALVFNSGCVTMEASVASSKVQCTKLFNEAGISLSDDKDRFSKTEYVHCVSNLINARQNQHAANALLAAYVSWLWFGFVLPFIKK